MPIDLDTQIQMVREEMSFDLRSGEFEFGEWQRKNTPFNTERDAWLGVLNLHNFRSVNHLLVCVYEVRQEGKYFYIWEKREKLENLKREIEQ